MKLDIEHIEGMDINWLLSNGWTVQSNLVFRRCLEHLTAHKAPPPAEHIEQNLLRYGVDGDAVQITKIKEGLQDMIDIVNLFRH